MRRLARDLSGLVGVFGAGTYGADPTAEAAADGEGQKDGQREDDEAGGVNVGGDACSNVVGEAEEGTDGQPCVDGRRARPDGAVGVFEREYEAAELDAEEDREDDEAELDGGAGPCAAVGLGLSEVCTASDMEELRV